MDQVAEATLAVFVVGVIYFSGKLSSRVDALEEWRRELKEDVRKILDAIADVNTTISGQGR